LAAKEVAQNYRQYFGELALDTPLESQEVVMAGYGSLPEIARQLKLELEILRELNPALRNPVIRGQKYVPKGFRLRLPPVPGQDWERMMAQLATKIFKNYQKRSRIYTVRRGDTAGEIARLQGVKLGELIAANNLDARATIYVNQKLRIPLPGGEPITLAGVERRKTGGQNSTKSQKWPATKAQPLAEPTVDMVIAMRASAESEKAQEKNALESSPIKPAKGTAQKEKPPALARPEVDLFEKRAATAFQDQNRFEDKPKAATLPASYARASKPAVQAPEINPEILQGNLTVERIRYHQGKPIGTIRVEVEETLGHYAEWLGITAWEIRRLNGFPYGKAIHIAQRIKIPLHQVSKEEFEEKRFDYHKELSEDFFASYRVEKVKFYYIKKGDTIWNLALEEFEVPLWLIKKYNADLNFNALVPSQKLTIPIVEKIQA
jgi:membrane-bound lytic murein transglycosylase D